MGEARLWLDVPFAEKDEAKAAGARWDNAARRWFAPRPSIAALDRWAALPPVPDLLPGENRSFGRGLFVDLVPNSCWFTNVRSCVDQRDWERLRRMIFDRAGQRCEACGACRDADRAVWLEAHERWVYDDAGRVQRLRRLICLCTPCHRATHFGLAEVQGHAGEALRHLAWVNGWTLGQAQAHVDAAFAMWRTRSDIDWTLDLTMLTGAGIRLTVPPDAAGRREVAAATVAEIRGPRRRWFGRRAGVAG